MPTILHASTSNYALKSTKHGKRCIQPVDADGSELSDDASHAMKTTKTGRPFLQDTYDLFATLILSLKLGPHKKRFFSSTFSHSFTFNEAARNLASLCFSHSSEEASPGNSAKCRTVTTRTTYIMTRSGAKAMCSHFLDACLIKMDVKGIYQLTPKGLYILNRFVIKNNINAMHILQLLTSQPKCNSLYYLDRRVEDDEPVITSASMAALFRRFSGAQPTYSLPADKALDVFQRHRKLANGILVTKLRVSKKKNLVYEHCFSAVSAVEWPCEFTTASGEEEAAQLVAHFVRYGFVELVNDERKRNESAILYTVRSLSEKNKIAVAEGQFNLGAKAIYRITDQGSRVAGWGPSVPPGMQREFDNDRSLVGGSMDSSRTVTDDQNIRNKA
ncbi:uncharacterized protein LACBIDRAFT_311276 [Laccaria bicolor S238N-H82]|uniref:Predicted protein n=1 Tax=Laccaria bicolor (strain S238N-H82 / ATCC MYA-4686) TaxID=486041 RepID=B0CZM2_LACBS|nr:uncharacterized protein LACBIDRAFT_311276 [Laccaria bicolor S238N-H82]EDR12646.1 predicted protein [Laccaria bicolor S238N-H82]|eukprot:XP_001876910.1 predicted protein [Laccaria bicolor S238N-H82]